ncbi:MAG: PilT/PilU family type 4a pilus ATPase [Hyalangium sp.]|uniref:type IV pilus twitching motility protein PilT n=1 Tax=Hyalangium sp. TaxID=2028555 RepID=UPI00389A5160
MKPIAELLRYLSHPAITEIALTTGRSPMIKSLNGYEPVDSAVLTDEELNRTLLTMVGPSRAASVSDKPMKWSVRAEGVATLAVVAVRRGEGLSMRVMRTGDAAGTLPPKPAETPVPGVSASAASAPGPEEAPEASAPVSPSDMVPPMVAPLIPPVRRPSVTGLRVIKAGSPPSSASEPQAAPPAPAPQVSAPPPPAEALDAELDFSTLAPAAAPPIPTPPPVGTQAPAPAPPRALPPVSLQSPALTPSYSSPPVDDEPPLRTQQFPALSLNAPAPPAPRVPFGSAAPPASTPPLPAAPPVPASSLRDSVPPPPPPSEISSIDISILEEEPEKKEEHTPPLAYRPSLPPRTRPDFWRDLPSLLEEARRIGASDLHIVSGRPALFRVAGELKPDGEPLPPKKVEQMVLSQVPARLRGVFDRDGSCDFALQSEAHGRFRVNVCRQRTGLKGSFRAIARELPSLESLGLPLDIALATRNPHGLILVTGPAGHGKTSTLAALVDILNRETKRHILTVEDPVEHVHLRKRALVSQREVGTHTRSFASALRSALREDADVIVVGDLRDPDTVRLALNAAETGRLVLGTMNTPTAAKTLARLTELFPPSEQAQVRLTLASHLRLIVSQRLVPMANGLGLVAAAEVLPGSVALGHLIRENALSRLSSLQQRGKGLSAVRLDESLADLVRSGKTTLELAKGFAEQPDALEALVKGIAPELPPEPGSGGRKAANPVGSVMGRKSA